MDQLNLVATVSSRQSFQFRGKILNVEKASMDKILANEEIRSLFTAMGTGFGAEFDVSKARYQNSF